MTKDSATPWIMIVFVVAIIVTLIPPKRSYAEIHGHKCPGSHVVIVNGKFVDCTGNRSQSAVNMWKPS